MGIMSEFKEFAVKGNVVDMAVGIIIGGAFTAIVTALTTSIINPLITVITGGGTDMTGALVVPGTEIDFGAFIQTAIDFFIVAFVVFMLVKGVNSMRRKAEKEAAEKKA